MQSIKELEAIQQKTLDQMNLRGSREGTRVVVGLATCGIAAGARPVLAAFKEEVEKRNLQHVTVVQTGCIGMCRFEPMVEVSLPGQPKVTYVKVDPDKVKTIVAEHLVNGVPVDRYTIGQSDA